MSTKQDELHPVPPDLLDRFAPDCGLAVWAAQVCQGADDVPGILAGPGVVLDSDAPQDGGDVGRYVLHDGGRVR